MAELLVDSVLARLRATTQGPIEVLEKNEDSFTLRVGRHEEAILGLQIRDPIVPTFFVSYRALEVRRNGTRQTRDASGDGVLIQAVESIVADLVEHGVVMPEFF